MELPGGNYKVLFRLKVGDNTKSEPIAKLYVKATRAGTEQELASFTLRPIHFSRADTWEVFELPVEIRDNDTDIRIGVEFYGGVADLWCDWIKAVPAGTAIAGDLKVLGSGHFDSFLARRFLDYPEELVNEGDVGLTSFVSIAGGTAYVVAFEDGTVIYVNGLPQGSVNAGERLSLSLSAGDIVSANKPMMLHSTSERHVPITWKSTKFVIPFYRADPQIIYIFAPDADASVNIYIGSSSSPSTTVSVAKGTVKTVSLSVSPPKTVILESNAPILVAVASNNGNYDIRFIHPPEKELIGIPSTDFYVAALEDDTVIEWHQEDKSGTYKLNRGEMVRHAELGISNGGQYNAWPVRITANKPIMIGSFADGDGCDATCGLPPRALPTKMVLPVNAQWLSIAVPYPETTIRIYYQGVLKYEGIVSSPGNPLAPGLLYLRPTDIDSAWSNIPYGTVIEADKPVYVVFDCAETWLDDETVLLGINRRVWRLYKNPVLTLDVESLAVKGSITPLTGVLKAEGKLDCDALRIKGTEVIDASRNIKNLNSIQMGQIHIERTNEINNYDGPVYLQYRTGKGVVIGGTSNSFIDLRGDLHIGGKQILTADRALKNITSADIEGYIKAGEHGDFGSLRIAGTEVLDASRNLKNVSSADLGSLRIGGTEIITSDRVLKNLDRLDLMGAYLARPMLQPLGNLVFAETFDRYTNPSELDANWDVVTRSSNITFEPGFGGLGQSLRSQDTVGNKGLQLTKYIPATPVVVVRLMYKDRSGGNNIYQGIPSFIGDGSLHTYQVGGQIGYDAPDGTRKWICTIPQNEWIELLWYVDIRAGKFKLWVNGDYKGEFNVTQAGTYIDRIRFRSNFASDTEDYEIDNIQVWIPASVKHELAGSLDAEALRIKGTEVITANRQLKNVSADAGIITSGVLALDRIPTIPASKADPNFGTTGDRILTSSDTMYETTSTSYQLAWSVEIEALEDVKNVVEYVKAQIRVGPSSGGGSPPPPDSETYCPT